MHRYPSLNYYIDSTYQYTFSGGMDVILIRIEHIATPICFLKKFDRIMRKFSLPFLLIFFLCGNLHAQSGIADTAKIKELISELNAASKNNDYKTAAIIGKKLITLGMNDE